jgi:hypothetical protein
MEFGSGNAECQSFRIPHSTFRIQIRPLTTILFKIDIQ